MQFTLTTSVSSAVAVTVSPAAGRLAVKRRRGRYAVGERETPAAAYTKAAQPGMQKGPAVRQGLSFEGPLRWKLTADRCLGESHGDGNTACLARVCTPYEGSRNSLAKGAVVIMLWIKRLAVKLLGILAREW